MGAADGDTVDSTPPRGVRALRAAVGGPLLAVCAAVYFAQGFRSLSGLSMQLYLKRKLTCHHCTTCPCSHCTASQTALTPQLHNVHVSRSLAGFADITASLAYLARSLFAFVSCWVLLSISQSINSQHLSATM